MLKRLLLLAGLLSLAASPSFAAGTVPGFNLTPQFDLSGKAAPGCKLYVIQAGTTSTPQNAYQDTALTQVMPNPMSCDAAARLPQWFVADGVIKLRLTTSTGTQIFTGDNLLVVGPSSGGGGGGGTVDPTTIAATGDLKVAYGTSVLSGWVRANGRTVGSATSGATERANADVQALFVYLWGADTNLTVSGGRGVSAAADWSANKTIALPDLRGRVLAGLDDMGSSAAGRLTAGYFGSTGSCSSQVATVLGISCGGESQTLTSAQLPANIPNSALSVLNNTGWIGTSNTGNGGAGAGINSTIGFSALNTVTTTVTINPSGGSAHPIVQPTMLATYYIKL